MVFRLGKKKKRIAHCFRRSLLTYDDAALVQNRLALRLAKTLDGLPDTAFHRVLEIGCCTGGVSEIICRNKTPVTLYLNDLVSDFEKGVLKRLAEYKSTQFVSCFGDIEGMTLPSDLSLVLSGATFQWLSDLPAFINRLSCELQAGSYLAFSMFGAGTLKEFSSVTSVELQYHSDRALLALLEEQFVVESYEKYNDQLHFPSVREILKHIRATGVGGVSEYQWNKESLRLFEERYIAKYACEKGLPVSYSSSCYLARKR
jgi:malonyl-ACP O-methyltransferase BioC